MTTVNVLIGHHLDITKADWSAQQSHDKMICIIKKTHGKQCRYYIIVTMDHGSTSTIHYWFIRELKRFLASRFWGQIQFSVSIMYFGAFIFRTDMWCVSVLCYRLLFSVANIIWMIFTMHCYLLPKRITMPCNLLTHAYFLNPRLFSFHSTMLLDLCLLCKPKEHHFPNIVKFIYKALQCVSAVNISVWKYHTENREQRSITENRDTAHFKSP